MENIDYKKKLETVLELLNNAEELNMANYNHELVKRLNDTFIEVYLFVESALAEQPTELSNCNKPAVSKSEEFERKALLIDFERWKTINGKRYDLSQDMIDKYLEYLKSINNC